MIYFRILLFYSPKPRSQVRILIHCIYFAIAPVESPINVHANNQTSPYSLLVTWQSVPAASRNGIILGYKVSYTPVLVSGQTHIDTVVLVVTVSAPDQRVLLTELSSFTMYRIEVLAFNAVGEGPLSTPIYAGVCVNKANFAYGIVYSSYLEIFPDIITKRDVISHTRDSVSSHFHTWRSELKIRRTTVQLRK